MAIRPIHFSPPMVRAILDGKKTQTRRLGTSVMSSRIQTGDVLWVREGYRLEKRFDGFDGPLRAQKTETSPLAHVYEADILGERLDARWGKLRGARTMMKAMSRLVLTATAVRREALQDITEADAEREGMDPPYFGDGDPPFEEPGQMISRRMQYRNLWNRLNPETPWASNPEVIVIDFNVVHGNILQIAERVHGA